MNTYIIIDSDTNLEIYRCITEEERDIYIQKLQQEGRNVYSETKKYICG